MSEIPAALRDRVKERARGVCEYRRVPEAYALVAYEIDHVVALKHGGRTLFDNLALACSLCNNHKGTDLASIDPDTAILTRLFNPRSDIWRDHFAWRRAEILPLTGVGRVTVRLLQLNRRDRVAERNYLVLADILPIAE